MLTLREKFKATTPTFKASCLFAALFLISLTIGFATGELEIPCRFFSSIGKRLLYAW